MNKEEPHRDQAEKLRKRIEKVQDNAPTESGLPPRSEIHHHKKKKTKWKLKYPIIRLLVLFFILLPIVSLSIYTIHENENKGVSEKVTGGRTDYETVDVEKEVEEEALNESVLEEDIPEDPEMEPVETNPGEEPIDLSETATTKGGGDPKNSAQSSGGKDEPQYKYHKVQGNETLFSISMKYYSSKSGIDIIQQANRLNGNEIRVGQTLKIPVN